MKDDAMDILDFASSAMDRSSWPTSKTGLLADLSDVEAAELMPALESVRKSLLKKTVRRPLDTKGGYSGAMALRRGDAMGWVDPRVRIGLASSALEALVGDIQAEDGATGGTVVTVLDRDRELVWSELNPLYAATQVEMDLARLEELREHRDARACEILAQRNHHWAFWGNLLPLSPSRTPYTLELMAVMAAFASAVSQRCKVLYNQPRPHEYSQRVQPMIPVPGHGSFPGGHATESRLVALALMTLVPAASKDSSREKWVEELKLMVLALADRIAENREVAGLHFPSDTTAGKGLADGLFAGIVHRLMKQASTPPKDGGANPFRWLCNRALAEWQ